jgi:hypothetical protein
MSVPEPEAIVEAAPLEIRPGPAAAFTEYGDGWLGAGLAGKAARLAVAAWARAVNGDGATLSAIADPDAAQYLLNPVRKDWVVAPGPVVTGIEIWGFDTSADAPGLDVKWWFTGRQRHSGPTVPPGWAGYSGDFVGMLSLAFTGSGPWPWRLTSGHVDTLDGYLGYRFIRRDETADEYRTRTGSATGAGALLPSDTYQLVTGFAEHDVRFGGSATALVQSETVPTRDEAERLAWPAVRAETERALGPGDWRPSLSRLDMVRLLEEAPPVAPAQLAEGLSRALRQPRHLGDAHRMSVAAFAERYAASRRLSYEASGQTSGSPWFLASLDPKRSHSFLTGRLAGGAAGQLWYAEQVVHTPRGGIHEPWTVARYDTTGASPAGGLACVVLRTGQLLGGQLHFVSLLPGGLTVAATGHPDVDRRFQVGVTGDSGLPGRVFTADFTAWLGQLPYGKLGKDATCFQLQQGSVCVYTRGALDTSEGLDVFCERAAKIAAQLEAAAEPAIR